VRRIATKIGDRVSKVLDVLDCYPMCANNTPFSSRHLRRKQFLISDDVLLSSAEACVKRTQGGSRGLLELSQD
jgi:hypothetical protein